MESTFIPLMVVFPLITAVILNLLHGRVFVKHVILSLGFVLVLLPLFIAYGSHTFGAHTREAYGTSIVPGIVYLFNTQKMIVILVLCLIAYLSVVSYLGAFKNPSGVYLSFMVLGVASCTAAVLTDDIFNFYVFLEIALITQVALVIATGTLESIKASLKYLVVGNIAANMILLGAALLLSSAGSLNVTDIENHLKSMGPGIYSSPVLMLACGLLVFGWAYASGLYPFHNIKSELYGSAEPHAAGLIQTQTKFILVSFALILLRLFRGVDSVRPVMLALSMGAMVFGVVMALRQDDYKRLLSYHAVSQAGYVASGLSIGTPLGIVAGIFHAVNNALYKSALFVGCECVKYRSRTTDFHRLGGALTAIPFVGVLVLGAKFAISGIPPFNGFQSKLLLLKSALDVGLPEIAVVMILVSIATFVSMMKAFYMIYLRRNDVESIDEGVPVTHVVALFVLVALCVILGVYPELAVQYIRPLAEEVGLLWSVK
ncbi:MAG: proton-conducting transporter membrane subunit [Candidatus Altiarchaeota archaeon]